jgi:predicted ATPase
MLTALKLERFKNFRAATLLLGPLSTIIGANAAGKSNIRDAFRFLHGIARGYSLAEIIGEKWVEGGVLQWRGIRGGPREATFNNSPTFALEVDIQFAENDEERQAQYRIEVATGDLSTGPTVVSERLVVQGRGQFVFDSHPQSSPPDQTDPYHIAVRVRKDKRGFIGPQITLVNSKPVLSQLAVHPDVPKAAKELALNTIRELESFRFLDLSQEAMRTPSVPGQTVLGDRGENLSSVLLAICRRPELKQALTAWVKELTPMDASDFDFPSDQTGRVLVTLIERGGQKISAYSASDGTLRFLAIMAALLGPAPSRFYFFEELDNGIHPTRLHLLISLIEQTVKEKPVQIVTTTHSPYLLAQIQKPFLQHVSLVYRLPDHHEARIKALLDIPGAATVLRRQDLARLHASGWMENAVFFTDTEAPGPDQTIDLFTPE